MAAKRDASALSTSPQKLPKILFGTSSLGNLFSEPTHEEKKAVVEERMLLGRPGNTDAKELRGAGRVLCVCDGICKPVCVTACTMMPES